ncbi:hypothetical protein [Nonomuraea dietziae]
MPPASRVPPGSGSRIPTPALFTIAALAEVLDVSLDQIALHLTPAVRT